MKRALRRRVRAVVGAGVVVASLSLAPLEVTAAGAASGSGSGGGSLAISVVSGEADLVTGGDALVEVRVPSAGAARHLRVSHDGVDVTGAFTRVGERRFRGLVDGLDDGESTLVARTNGRGQGRGGGASRPHRARLTITNHAIAGPVLSGPHQVPFYCETEAAGLGPALDDDCFAPSQVVYRYRTTAGAFAPLAGPDERPADLTTVTLGDRELPYIVRVERGVINRGIYEIAALHDGAEPSPVRAEDSWNGKLVMTFGGGCNVGYHQGDRSAGVLNDDMLRRGYAVASNSLLINDNNCNPVLAAETAMMTKERVVESYGPITHTIGFGGSGGAIMQYTITHAYPGILDGLLPAVSFPDALSNAGPADCSLLLDYAGGAGAGRLSDAQLQAIGGHRTYTTCLAWDISFADRIDATRGCPDVVPADTVYHPETNPTGVRCAISDHLVNILGVADDGFAPFVYDNDGVQYGLGALQTGVIDVEQFLHLNENIGGYDRDGLPQAGRTVVDPAVPERVSSTGLVVNGTGGLAATPTIDLRAYSDDVIDIHTSFWSVAVHERLVRDGVDPRLHSRWIWPRGGNHTAEALDAMDEWLTAIAADRRPGSPARRAARNRPASAAPGCWPTADGPKVEDLDACYTGPFPYSGDLRTVAGAPITSDGICQKAEPSPDDYAVAFTPEQWERLLATYPNGVCDYTEPGIGQVPLDGTWQRYD
jgi:hypothetical protein